MDKSSLESVLVTLLREREVEVLDREYADTILARREKILQTYHVEGDDPQARIGAYHGGRLAAEELLADDLEVHERMRFRRDFYLDGMLILRYIKLGAQGLASTSDPREKVLLPSAFPDVPRHRLEVFPSRFEVHPYDWNRDSVNTDEAYELFTKRPERVTEVQGRLHEYFPWELQESGSRFNLGVAIRKYLQVVVDVADWDGERGSPLLSDGL